MSGKNDHIIEFSGDAEFFYARYRRSLDRREYFSALENLRRAAYLARGPRYRLELADFLMRFDLHPLAEVELLHTLSEYPEAGGGCFSALSRLYYAMGDPESGNNYFHRLLSEGGGFFEDDDAEDFFELSDDDDETDYSGYKLVYPRTDESWQESVEQAKALIGGGDYADGDALLREVPRESGAYVSARSSLALSLLLQNRTEEALEISNASLKEFPDDVLVACTACSVYNYAGEEKRAKEVLSSLRDFESEDIYLLYKVAAAFCELSEDEGALPFLEKLLELRPMDRRALRMKAIALFNLGRYEASRDTLLDLLVIDPKDLAAKGYLSLIAGVTAAGGADIRLPYMFMLPPPVAEPLVRKLGALLSAPKPARGEVTRGELSDLFEYCLAEVGKAVPALLSHCEDIDGVADFLRAALLSSRLDLKNKRTLLAGMAMRCHKGKVDIVVHRDFRQKVMRYPRGFLKMDDVWRQAYALALSVILTYSENFTGALVGAVADMYALAKERGVGVESAETLAAVLTESAVSTKTRMTLGLLHGEFKFKSKDFHALKAALVPASPSGSKPKKPKS